MVGSRGEILSQASTYWAEPHKDVLLMDCTSLTSNKTKVEKPSEFEAPVNPCGYFVWAIEREQKREGEMKII